MSLFRPFIICASALSLIALIAASEAASSDAASRLLPSIPNRPKVCQKAPAALERLEALGPTWHISEPDILEAFKERVRKMQKTGEYDRRFNENKKRIASELERPRGVEGILKAEGLSVSLLEASIPEKLPPELLLKAQSVPEGRFSRPLLFIDGEDEESLKAAKRFVRLFPQTRVVLINGAPSEVSEQLDKRVFFDQGGALCRLFRIKSAPALLFNSPEGPSRAEFAPSSLAELLPLLTP